MRFDRLKTRHGKLKAKLEDSVLKKTIGPNEIDLIIDVFDEYEKDNLASIEKLKRTRTVDAKKINGALKQTINAHGPITKLLIGSASKRILGSLMEVPVKKKTIIERLKDWIQ